MKPIKLKMSAFGPYADVRAVDFSAFDGKGLSSLTGTWAQGNNFQAPICFCLSVKQTVLHETAKCSAVTLQTAPTRTYVGKPTLGLGKEVPHHEQFSTVTENPQRWADLQGSNSD